MCSAESIGKVAEALCHELSHARMFLFLENDPLLADDFVARHRSPWRRDTRPLIGLVNGVHAFLNVCRLYARLRERDEARWAHEANTIIGAQQPKIREAWAYVQAHATWTAGGERVAHELGEAVAALCN